LYARFWHKVLYDLGVVSCKEPFQRLTNQGLILAENGQKMSKSLGNVVNPDDVIKEFGADSLRLYEMFMGPLEMVKPWSTTGTIGIRKFLDKVWRLFEQKPLNDTPPSAEVLKILHQTIKKVGNDINNLSFNTAISQMMIFTNAMQDKEMLNKQCMAEFLKILAPFAPHLAEELWENLGNKTSIHLEKWPQYDEKYLVENTMTIVFSINGKPRDTVQVAKDTTKDVLEKMAMENEKIKRNIEGKKIVKVIVVPNKMINIVVQ